MLCEGEFVHTARIQACEDVANANGSARMELMAAFVLSVVCSTIDIYRQTAKEFVNFVLSAWGNVSMLVNKITKTHNKSQYLKMGCPEKVH